MIQGLQDLLAARLLCDSIAQAGGQPAKDGCLEQELLNPGGLPLEHFPNQVVQHVAAAAGESRDETRDVLAPLNRQPR